MPLGKDNQSKRKLPWLRLYHRIIDDDKIRLLSFEDRWHFVALLCMKCEGILDDKPSELRSRKIAVKLGLRMAEADEALRRIYEVGLIDKSANPVSWDDICAFSSNDMRPPAHAWRVIRERIFLRDDFTCTYCGERGGRLECDHIFPVSLGGSHGDENLTTSCRACNRSKRSKSPEEWAGRGSL